MTSLEIANIMWEQWTKQYAQDHSYLNSWKEVSSVVPSQHEAFLAGWKMAMEYVKRRQS